VLLWLSDSAERIDAAATSGATRGGEEDDALSSSSSSDSEEEEDSASSSTHYRRDGLAELSSLPPGWVEHFSEEYSRCYYSNPTTGASSWERPML
jgi:hypothetical protein